MSTCLPGLLCVFFAFNDKEVLSPIGGLFLQSSALQGRQGVHYPDRSDQYPTSTLTSRRRAAGKKKHWMEIQIEEKKKTFRLEDIRRLLFCLYSYSVLYWFILLRKDMQIKQKQKCNSSCASINRIGLLFRIKISK